MKKVLGYYYRTGSETVRKALSYCADGVDQGFAVFRTESKARKVAESDRKLGLISKRAKVKVFKIVAEEV